MSDFNEWLHKGRNYRGDAKPEYYEDAHARQPVQSPYTNRNGEQSAAVSDSFGRIDTQYVPPRLYQNVVVYSPTTPEDVQTLIDYQKRREPAVVNLDGVGDPTIAQRILDFISGAIYALNGSVHRISSNIFLLSPEGVEITVPYEPGKN